MSTLKKGSEIYRMGNGRFAAELFSRYMPWWAWIIAAIGIIGVIAGAFIDMRISILALMIVLIVMPMIIGFLYYYHALSRECFINRLPHSVAVKYDSLIVTLYIKEPEDSESDDGKDESGNEDKPEEPHYRTRDEAFLQSQIKGWELKPSGGYVSLEGKNKGFLYVPYDAFGDGTGFKELGEWINNAKTT